MTWNIFTLWLELLAHGCQLAVHELAGYMVKDLLLQKSQIFEEIYSVLDTHSRMNYLIYFTK